MTIIDEIYQEYVRMRNNGVDSKAALRALRTSIERLRTADRQMLAEHIQAWEHKLASDKPPLTQKRRHSKKVKRLKKLASQPKEKPVPNQTIWIECPNCQRKNQEQEVFCYHCGLLLSEDEDRFSTRTFAPATEELHTREYFSEDSILVLQGKEVSAHFELRPQRYQRDLIIGRSTENQAMHPDIDLTHAQGAERGVSRLHVALTYDPAKHVLYISDLGSSNGTFINGNKLNSSDPVKLHSGDELHIGRLAMKVTYYHPGEELA